MGTVRYTVDDLHNVTEIHKVVVYRFHLSDVEDTDIRAAEPIYKWEQSEQGQFVMKHAIDKPVWHKNIDHVTYSYQYVIVAELEMKKLAEFYLRFGQMGKI